MFFQRKRTIWFCDSSVIITSPYELVNPKNIYLGPNVVIGPNATLSALNAKFICKGHTAIAANLTVHTGDHARIPGMYMTSINESIKPAGYDSDVIIEEDVWIGTNVTILCDVTIGRGVTVAAGAVVTKSMPPYCICGGVPAKVIKFYWNVDQILEYERQLYSVEKRLSKDYIETMMKEYQK